MTIKHFSYRSTLSVVRNGRKEVLNTNLLLEKFSFNRDVHIVYNDSNFIVFNEASKTKEVIVVLYHRCCKSIIRKLIIARLKDKVDYDVVVDSSTNKASIYLLPEQRLYRGELADLYIKDKICKG